MTERIVADGIRYIDERSGQEKWLTGPMLMAHIRQAIEADRRRLRSEMFRFAEELGRRWGVERRLHNEEVARLKSEIETLKRSTPLRAVGGKSAVG